MKDMMDRLIGSRRSAAHDGDFLGLGDPANAVPAILADSGEPLEAVEVDGDVSSLFSGGLFADGEAFVDVVDAADFLSVGAVVVGHLEGEGKSDEHQEDQNSHCRFYIINSV